MRTVFNDLDLKIREKMVKLLNQLLADGVVLYTHVKEAHWTVRGSSFIAIHELFDKVGEHVLDINDTMAERIQQLGGTAHGIASVAAKHTTLPPYPENLVHEKDHVIAVSKALSHFAKDLRQGIEVSAMHKDAVTADILTELTRDLDKDLWFVESHLEKVVL